MKRVFCLVFSVLMLCTCFVGVDFSAGAGQREFVRFEQAGDYQIIENTTGYIYPDDNNEFYYYTIPSFNDGDTIVLYDYSEEEEIQYIYSSNKNAFVSDDAAISADMISKNDYQYANHWTVGGNNIFTITYLGTLFELKVNIISRAEYNASLDSVLLDELMNISTVDKNYRMIFSPDESGLYELTVYNPNADIQLLNSNFEAIVCECDYGDNEFILKYEFTEGEIYYFDFVSQSTPYDICLNKLTLVQLPNEGETDTDEHIHTFESKVVEATCTDFGYTEKICSCGYSFKVDYTDPVDHSYKNEITPAKTDSNGKSVPTCSCGATKSATTIYKVSTVKLNYTSLTYNGKNRSVGVTVKDSKGKALTKGTDYTVSWDKTPKNVGVYTCTVKFKGKYTGSKKLTLKVNPASTTLSSVSAQSKALTPKWKKQATQTTGYEIQCATDSKFTKNKKTVTVSNTKTTSKKVTGLKAKTKYYVRVRTYKTVKVNGKNTKLYSGWSKVKTVTTKK